MDDLEDQLGYGVAFYIFIAIFLFTMFPHAIPYLAKLITLKLVKEEMEEKDLKQERITLHRELGTIHMVDEFAKYAKTERKIIKATEQLKVYEKNRSDFLTKVRISMTVVFQVIRVIFMGLLLWLWKSYPVLRFDEYSFIPVSWLISFPSQVPGGIGLIPWMLICGTVVKKISSLLICLPHAIKI